MNSTYSFTFPESNTSNARCLSGKKEVVATRKLINFNTKTRQWKEPIDARWYMARSADGAGAVYCSVWIRSACGKHNYSGSGTAKGHGYCKKSAAFAAALRAAGIKASRDVDECGMEAVREAIEALGTALGWTNTYLSGTN